MSRRLPLVLIVPTVAVALVVGVLLGGTTGGPTTAVNPVSSSPPASIPLDGGSPSLGPSLSPSPTPAPTPVLAAAPLDGLLVTPAAAKLHVVAVMIDDLSPARPQSGFSDASVVWQAPAEGGIPRYMLMFQERTPKAVGPVRSARYYYIAWAAEWHAMYVHAGGSPQALATLRAQGNGQLVYNADEFRWGSSFWRVTNRYPPHNLYTDGKHLRQLTTRVGATQPPAKAAWRFGPDAPLERRPVGGRIEVDYLANAIVYRYDRSTNTYRRYVSGGKRHVDAATGQAIAPKNVVVMRMQFGPLNDGAPNKHRLEAKVIGSGTAWIATNGRTVRGTWRKKSLTSPTRFYDAAGHQVLLTAGQTFVQVMKTTDVVKIQDGKAPPPTSPIPSSSGSPGSSPSARVGGGIAAI